MHFPKLASAPSPMCLSSLSTNVFVGHLAMYLVSGFFLEKRHMIIEQLLEGIQKLRNGKRGEGSTILLRILTYILRENDGVFYGTVT